MEIGYYDDSCRQCGREQTVSIESANTAIIDTLAKGSVEAFNLGLQVERERITAILRGHITVCNYKAVNEEECDVCDWADSTIAIVNGKNE